MGQLRFCCHKYNHNAVVKHPRDLNVKDKLSISNSLSVLFYYCGFPTTYLLFIKYFTGLSSGLIFQSTLRSKEQHSRETTGRPLLPPVCCFPSASTLTTRGLSGGSIGPTLSGTRLSQLTLPGEIDVSSSACHIPSSTILPYLGYVRFMMYTNKKFSVF